jgi:L-amino acid N-acyltransferase YncA
MARARGVIVRSASVADASAIAATYAHHVLYGTASFETEPPTVDFWAAKIADVIARQWPFIVATDGNSLLGYAYATQFRDRAAYAHTCENSIYVRHDAIGHGVGIQLMTALIDRAGESGFREIIAVVGGGEPASIALHAKCGFRHAGRMENVGRKFGRLLDTVYMQLSLGDKA